MLKPQNQPLNLTDGTPCQQTTMRFYKYEVLVKFLIYYHTDTAGGGSDWGTGHEGMF